MSRLCAILLVAASTRLVAGAQGSGTIVVPDTVSDPDTSSGSDSPFLVTRTVKGRIAGIKKDPHVTIVLIENNRGQRGALRINSKTKFKADKGTEYAGKKHITPEDLEIGQSVKIIFVANSSQVLELRLTAKT
jgi:hypothetical protein